MAIERFQGAYKWLSNFWLVDVTYEGVVYPSTEHAYQAAKTKDPTQREWVRSAPTCGRARKRGQQVILREDWENIKIDVMHEVLEQKFQHEELKGWLLDTEDEHLVEGNHWGDSWWGVCEGRGLNHLGRLLMTVRETLRKEKLDNC